MANLSAHGYGYMAVYEEDKTREEREASLERDYGRNLASHKKTKQQLMNGISVWNLEEVLLHLNANIGLR
jgi:hypothetical protein